jgi:hypothetical protein
MGTAEVGGEHAGDQHGGISKPDFCPPDLKSSHFLIVRSGHNENGSVRLLERQDSQSSWKSSCIANVRLARHKTK